MSKYDASKYELLCLNRDAGGRDSLDKFDTCNIAMAPSRTWLSAKDFLSDVSIAHTPLSLAELLSDRTDLFNIYGEFLKNNNIIFNVSICIPSIILSLNVLYNFNVLFFFSSRMLLKD